MDENPYKSPETSGASAESPITSSRSRRETLQLLFRVAGAICGAIALGFLLVVLKNYGNVTMFRPLLGAAASGGLSATLFYLARIMPDY